LTVTNWNEELDMADITVDNEFRFTMENVEGDHLHIFRVPAGTVVHVAGATVDGSEHAQAILIEDEDAPAVIAALSRMVGGKLAASA
jgi:hypothetical protein